MKNNQTGPITAAGKKESAKNAIKHGATSAKLINEDEQSRYESLLAALNNQYKSSNPLLQLQITRIARLNIQLERIQNVIDASFKKSRIRANSSAKVMESFTQQNTQIEELAGRLFDAKSHADVEKSRAIAFELLNAEKINEIQSKEEFVQKFPRLSSHFSDKEKSSKSPIQNYLLEEVAIFSSTHKKYCDAIREQDKIEEKIENFARDHDSIEKVELSLMKMFAAWYKNTFSDFFVGPEAYLTVQESIKMEEDAMLPEAQEMDRLMRYQTTLQRQLSSAIGELLAIKKIDTSSA